MLKAIPACVFFTAPINVRGVKGIIILEVALPLFHNQPPVQDDIEQTMRAAMDIFSKMRFSGVTLEIKKRLPPTVTAPILDHFLKTVRCGFVRMQMNCHFRLQDVPSLDRVGLPSSIL